MNRKRVQMYLVIVVVMLLAVLPKEGSAALFKDVDTTHRAYEQISTLTNKGIIQGTNDGYFLPHEPITRAAAAAFVGRSLGLDGTTRNTSFSDVSSNVFASGYIEELKKRGIINGYPGGTFKPGDQINRGEVAIMIARAFKLGDVTKSSQASLLLMQKGISSGKLDGTFGETESIIRSDIAVFIANAMKLGIPDWTIADTSYFHTQTIIVDPGHGGKDPGAIGFGLKEKDVVLDVSKQVNSLFVNKTPFNVKMTRYNDNFIELKDRVGYAKQNNGNVFVSVHANAFNGSASGTETYYYKSSAVNPHTADSKLLADKIQARMLKALNLTNRKVKSTKSLYVLKNNTMPAALAELGFIDNKGDSQKLASRTYRTKAAEAIYLGILDYYEAKGINVSAYK